MPYERIDLDTYDRLSGKVEPLDWNRLYDGESLDAVGESGCTTDVCEVKFAKG